MSTINFRDPGSGSFVPIGGDATPIGTIMGWGGSVAPAGWHICDGTAHGSAEFQALWGLSVTPDLRDKFIIGSSATRPIKTTGGASSVTLTAAQSGVPAHAHTSSGKTGGHSATHTHSVTPPSTGSHTHSHGYVMNDSTNTTLTDVNNVDYPIRLVNSGDSDVSASASHTHSGTSAARSVTHGHTGTTTAALTVANATASHENRPPYYAMVYIVKVT